MWDRFVDRTRWHAYANQERYDAPADPWRLVAVDPGTVGRFNSIPFGSGLGQVRGGDWDQPDQCGRIENLPIYRGLKQRYHDGCGWEETAYYEWVAERFEVEVEYRGYETIEDRLDAVDELHESMREQGYRPNRGVEYDDPREIRDVHALDPLVLVGRSGAIIWSEGFHRLVLAQLLRIKEVPVYVLQRHEQWQRIRDEIAGSSPDDRRPELSAYLDHPDVTDIAG